MLTTYQQKALLEEVQTRMINDMESWTPGDDIWLTPEEVTKEEISTPPIFYGGDWTDDALEIQNSVEKSLEFLGYENESEWLADNQWVVEAEK